MNHETRKKGIRAKCIDCSNGQLKEVRLCPAIKCALWPFRMGKRPRKPEQGPQATR
jgi:hypothetical protein